MSMTENNNQSISTAYRFSKEDKRPLKYIIHTRFCFFPAGKNALKATTHWHCSQKGLFVFRLGCIAFFALEVTSKLYVLYTINRSIKFFFVLPVLQRMQIRTKDYFRFQQLSQNQVLPLFTMKFNPLRAKFIKWSNTLKQIVGKLPTICLSVFDHFSGLALKGLIKNQLR